MISNRSRCFFFFDVILELVLLISLAPPGVVAVLHSHGEANAEVAWQGLWAMQHLAAVHAANAADLLNSGACAGIQSHALAV